MCSAAHGVGREGEKEGGGKGVWAGSRGLGDGRWETLGILSLHWLGGEEWGVERKGAEQASAQSSFHSVCVCVNDVRTDTGKPGVDDHLWDSSWK